jgi:hypothetical protein
MTAPLAVYLEIGPKRTFAGATEWPGWCRGGRAEEEALAALLAYALRYAQVVEAAGLTLPAAADLDVTERLAGGSGTDFGVPSVAPAADDRPLDKTELDRQSRLLAASWQAFDIAWQEATDAGIQLRKGPRGGGRDLAKMEAHVLEAEEAYLTRLGSRVPRAAGRTVAERMTSVRETALAALAARAQDEPIADPSSVERRWSPRYFVRRSAWHVLDHAWEIEDRSAPD